jgi:Carboxypeptidase regulatory-like domain/TonB-dependent Receptor Plug Domain
MRTSLILAAGVASGGLNRSSRTFRLTVFAALIACCLALNIPGSPALGQTLGTSGSIEGTVLDPSGATVKGAAVEIQNPVSGYVRSATTDDSGAFNFDNVPFNPYHLSATHAGFQPVQQDVEVQSGLPVKLKIKLRIAAVATSITVTTEANDLLETTPVEHTDVDESLITHLPIQSPSIGLSQVITNATPGVVADANGFFHPLGEHADTSISVDGQPISDQQSKVFSNQVPLEAVQSMEVVSGAPPAQYGDMTSLIINTTMKSGLGLKKTQGSFSSQYGSFGSWSEALTLGVGGNKWGNFASFTGDGSSRFLDPPEFTAFHDRGNDEGFFDRVDFQPGTKDSLHLDVSAGRSWFQIPNTYDQLSSGQDQREQVKSVNISPEWTHLFGGNGLVAFQPFARITHVQYFPSADTFSDLPATVGQDRRQAHYGFTADLTYSRGPHEIKAGMKFASSPLTENFALGITDPAFNPVCLDPNGNPVLDPSLTDPAACSAGGFAPNPAFAPGLVPYDLTRGGNLFDFHGYSNIKEVAFYAQDSVTLGPWKLNGGVREDVYRGLSRASALEPRAAIAYNIKSTNTVLRVSYARLFDTPYYENLLLSSATGAGGLSATGIGAFGQAPLVPGRRHQFNAGLEQAVGKYLVVNAGYFWKYTHDDFDFDTLFSSPITFPIQWRKSKIDGASVRVNLTDFHGLTAYSVLGHARARFFGPEVGGLIFNSPLSVAAFRIDHDQNFQQTTHIQYRFHQFGGVHDRNPWVGLTWQYESGLVAGSVPDLASALALDADQQAAIGFFCGNTVATLTDPISSCNLPYPQWGATRVQIPAPGTENDDTNPPRISPRNLLDLGAGMDNIFHADRYKLNVQFTVINLANKVALFNFLSTFSGTHFVTPRVWQGQVKLVF